MRPGNVKALVEATGVREVHLSAGGFRGSGMTFRRPEVRVGTQTAPDEHAQWFTDGDVVAGVVAALRGS